MLDFAARRDTSSEPYHWSTVHGLLPAEVRSRLRDTMPPLAEFTRSERTAGGDKTYGMYVLPLVHRGEPLPALDKAGSDWAEFTTAIQGEDYRAWVREVVGADVGDASFDVGLFVFRAGDWVSSHTDKSDKSATHVLYLNEEWGAGDGGEFLVRGTAGDDAPVHAAISPGGGRSVLFARSDNSWHAVAPVAEGAPELRCTVQVEMWR
ncbi:2OG-Fe(II) oxygenase [Streptomyces sparsus]